MSVMSAHSSNTISKLIRIKVWIDLDFFNQLLIERVAYNITDNAVHDMQAFLLT